MCLSTFSLLPGYVLTLYNLHTYMSAYSQCIYDRDPVVFHSRRDNGTTKAYNKCNQFPYLTLLHGMLWNIAPGEQRDAVTPCVCSCASVCVCVLTDATARNQIASCASQTGFTVFLIEGGGMERRRNRGGERLSLIFTDYSTRGRSVCGGWNLFLCSTTPNLFRIGLSAVLD